MQFTLALTTLAALASSVVGQSAFAVAYNGELNGSICDGEAVGTAFQIGNGLDSVCSPAPGAKCVRWLTNPGQYCTLWYCFDGDVCYKDGASSCANARFEEHASGALELPEGVGSIEYQCYDRGMETGAAIKPRATAFAA